MNSSSKTSLQSKYRRKKPNISLSYIIEHVAKNTRNAQSETQQDLRSNNNHNNNNYGKKQDNTIILSPYFVRS